MYGENATEFASLIMARGYDGLRQAEIYVTNMERVWEEGESISRNRYAYNSRQPTQIFRVNNRKSDSQNDV